MQQKSSLSVEIIASFLVYCYVAIKYIASLKISKYIAIGFAVACGLLVTYVLQKTLFWRINYVTLEIPEMISEDGIYEFAIDINPDEIPDKQGRVFQKDISKDIIIKKSDTLFSILKSLNVSNAEATKFLNKFKTVSSVSNIVIGKKINISYNCVITYQKQTINNNYNNILPTQMLPKKICNIEKFIAIVNNDKRVIVESAGNEDFRARIVGIKTKVKKMLAKSTISNNFFNDAVKSGVPSSLVYSAITEYGFDVDFQRDVHRGDSFMFVFEEILDETNSRLRFGKLLYSDLILNKKHHQMYMFNNEFYNENGEGVRKPLLKTPIDGARVSSGFGARKHPVHGYTRMHQGIDFAAPYGTPIYAAGEGVIEFVGKKNGYGNFISIRHVSHGSVKNKESCKTNYAHMKGFRKGISVGTRVSQRELIGYVGATGVATGPHLHYEIVKNGVKVNPAKQKFMSAKQLDKKQMLDFKQFVKTIDEFSSNH